MVTTPTPRPSGLTTAATMFLNCKRYCYVDFVRVIMMRIRQNRRRVQRNCSMPDFIIFSLKRCCRHTLHLPVATATAYSLMRFLQDDIVHTLRAALFTLEQQVPLCFMHSRWEQYRKMWGRMLVKNDTVKAFAVVLGILEMAIRRNAKKNVWNEGIGQVRSFSSF